MDRAASCPGDGDRVDNRTGDDCVAYQLYRDGDAARCTRDRISHRTAAYPSRSARTTQRAITHRIRESN